MEIKQPDQYDPLEPQSYEEACWLAWYECLKRAEMIWDDV